MRVGIDGRALAAHRAPRGIARYTATLIDELSAAYPDDEWRVLIPGRAPTPLAAWPSRPNLIVRRHPLPSRALFGPAGVVPRPRLDRLLGGDLDLVWAPQPAPLAVSRDVPLVLTVHDLSWERRPRDYTRYERVWHRLARPERLARRARRVIAVSAATGADVAARWPAVSDRVSVVRPGVTRPDAGREPSRGLPDGYFLFVGALERRKAPDLLVEAYGRARAHGLEAELVLVGSGPLAQRLRAPGVRLLGGVSEAELGPLYAGAVALVAPSWIEGFGFPPLEALAVGTPAVVSDLPVFRETLGDGALRFPLGDAEALAAALARVAGEPDLRARLAAAGGEAVARLTWRRAARELHDALASSDLAAGPAAG